MTSPDSSDDVRQVLIHPALLPALEEWLASRGLEMRCIGKLGEDDLASWLISPTDEKIAAMSREQHVSSPVDKDA